MGSIKFGIITVSDSCYAGAKEDKSGSELKKSVTEYFPSSQIVFSIIVPDFAPVVEATLKENCLGTCNVILTTGGTGFAPRDVTPEATRAVIEKEAPGLSYAMISRSLEKTHMAMLSRAVCGIRNNTLIINLPGSVKGASECFTFIKDSIPHAVELLTGNQSAIEKTHRQIQEKDHEPSKVKINKPAFRSRQSLYPMLSVEEAGELIISHTISPNETEYVSIQNSLNRILSQNIFAKDNLPPFPASIKDGYAVISTDGAGTRTVKDVIAAGNNPEAVSLTRGEIVRISTGAPLPKGADAVVQVEDTELVKSSPDGSEELEVLILTAPEVGQDIRPIGSDIKIGDLVLKKGERISVGEAGVLATVGVTKVPVFKQPRVGILSSGNELQSPDEKLKPGCIRDSNKTSLLCLLKENNFIAQDFGIIKDNPDDVKSAFIKAFSQVDVVITTGGVSMGEFDIIKEVLCFDFGATVHFGRINMKPGKPTTFATCDYEGKKKLIFGLPGNPVSALVTSILFVLPSLRKFSRESKIQFPKIQAVLKGWKGKLDTRPEYLRVSLTYNSKNSSLIANPTGNQISSRLNSFVGAAGLLRLPGKNGGDLNVEGSSFEVILIDKNAIGISL